MLTFLRYFFISLLSLHLIACTPALNWREVNHPAGQFSAWFPNKTKTLSKDVVLDNTVFKMTMLGTQADNMTFAVSYIPITNTPHAHALLNTFKTGFLTRVHGQILRQNAFRHTNTPNVHIDEIYLIDTSQPTRRLIATRFLFHKQHLYQITIMGPENVLTSEVSDTFFTSLKLF
jgi:hypothetical protein